MTNHSKINVLFIALFLTLNMNLTASKTISNLKEKHDCTKLGKCIPETKSFANNHKPIVISPPKPDSKLFDNKFQDVKEEEDDDDDDDSDDDMDF